MSFVPNVARRATIHEILQSFQIITEKIPGSDKTAKFALLPTGERANNIFIIGTVTRIKKDDKFISATLRDKTGKISVRASYEFQKFAYMQLDEILKAGLPAHVAINGRINVYEPEEKKEGGPTKFISLAADGVALVERPYRDLYDETVLAETIRRIDAWDPDALTDDQNAAATIYGEAVKDGILQAVQTAYHQQGVAEV